MARNRHLLTAQDLGLHTQHEEALDVLDLPQLYTKPSAVTLLATLDDLTFQPASWEATPRAGTPRGTSGTTTPLRRRRKVKSDGLPHYLTNIIASPLAWIEDDAEKEQIWEAASQRLSERSGRTAMGAISRTFVIPLHPAETGDDANVREDGGDALEITLHEPALTADNLGLKTWASSYLLAKRMVSLRDALPVLAPDAQILELGAGTGLVGLAAAAVLKRTVILTDLPDIVPNLERNVRSNAAMLATHNVRATTAVLDWSEPASFSVRGEQQPSQSFPLVLAADPVYSSEHPELLVQAITEHLARHIPSRVVVEMPIREAYAAERTDFRDRMGALALEVVDEGEEVGFDDWSNGRDEEDLTEVKCWWSVWARGGDCLPRGRE